MAKVQQTNSKVRYDTRHARLKEGETQRENNSYVYRWTDDAGKRHAVYAPTLDQLRSKENQITVDKHDGIKSDVNSLTVNRMYDLWKEIKTGIKDSSFKNYMYMYDTFVKSTFGRKRLTTATKSDVKRFYKKLNEQDGLKVSTIENIHTVLYQVFQVAVDDNLIRKNPVEHALKDMRRAKGHEVEKRKALTKAQQSLFLNYLLHTNRYLHWYPVFYIMLNTGMRVGEITGLRWCDVDFANNVIRVDHTLVYYNHRDEKGCYYSMNTPKTEAGCREIPMTDGVRKAFLRQKEYLDLAELKSVDHIDGYRDFIFLNKDGRVQNMGCLNKALNRIIRDCNLSIIEENDSDSEADPVLLPHFSCHILRHTFATRLCESGVNIKVIQAVLGHADIETTMNIYIDVTEELKQDEMKSYETYVSATAEDKPVQLRVI